jgi:hypothetical protein
MILMIVACLIFYHLSISSRFRLYLLFPLSLSSSQRMIYYSQTIFALCLNVCVNVTRIELERNAQRVVLWLVRDTFVGRRPQRCRKWYTTLSGVPHSCREDPTVKDFRDINILFHLFLLTPLFYFQLRNS